MIRKYLAALLLLLGLLAPAAVSSSAAAKDITWGRAAAGSAQLRDITWGKQAASTPQARKGWPGGSIEFTRYGGGTTRYILFACNSGVYGSIYPGQWSKNEGGCADVDAFYVESGSKLFCGERFGVTSRVFYPGWYEIGNARYWACEKRAHNG